MSIHKKIPGVFDSARDSVPVAHDDSTTLLGICTHEAGRCLKVFKRTRPLPPQDTTQPPPPAEQPTERTACSRAWFSGKTPHDGQTAPRRASSLGVEDRITILGATTDELSIRQLNDGLGIFASGSLEAIVTDGNWTAAALGNNVFGDASRFW